VNGNKKIKIRGFTIVELLIVLSVIALLLSIVTPRYLNKVEEGKEIALKQNLSIIRRSIDQYYSDQGVYPDRITQLVEKKYLREIPIDPIAGSKDWIIIKEKKLGGVYDIKSTSQQIGRDDKAYSEW